MTIQHLFALLLIIISGVAFCIGIVITTDFHWASWFFVAIILYGLRHAIKKDTQ